MNLSGIVYGFYLHKNFNNKTERAYILHYIIILHSGVTYYIYDRECYLIELNLNDKFVLFHYLCLKFSQ